MSEPTRAEQVAELAKLVTHFAAFIPLNDAMGIELVDVGDGFAVERLPWAEHLVGDPESGVLHGGAITALLDACCGAAAFMGMDAPQNIATLDLRIDYLRPATPHLAVTARAEVTRRTRQVIFLRCVAFHDEDGHGLDRPIATGNASFMLGTPRGLHDVARSGGAS